MLVLHEAGLHDQIKPYVIDALNSNFELIQREFQYLSALSKSRDVNYALKNLGAEMMKFNLTRMNTRDLLGFKDTELLKMTSTTLLDFFARRLLCDKVTQPCEVLFRKGHGHVKVDPFPSGRWVTDAVHIFGKKKHILRFTPGELIAFSNKEATLLQLDHGDVVNLEFESGFMKLNQHEAMRTRDKNVDALLFHGTDKANQSSIEHNGLLVATNPTHGDAMGPGIYGAVSPRKAMMYTHPMGGDQFSTLYLCRFNLKDAETMNKNHGREFRVPDAKNVLVLAKFLIKCPTLYQAMD